MLELNEDEFDEANGLEDITFSVGPSSVSREEVRQLIHNDPFYFNSKVIFEENIQTIPKKPKKLEILCFGFLFLFF
jgi:hypothetical protein